MNRQIPLGTVCLLLAVMACQVGCSNSPEVEAVIRIDRFPMFGEKLTTRDYDIYRETQAALLKSKFVLTGALRPHSDLHRDISQLPMVQTREQPVDWLENAIQFEVVPNSELIRVKMSLARSTSESELEQTEKVLNAVVSAYLSEIVNKERLQQLMMLNTLRKRYQTNYENIKRKSDEVDKLKAQLGQVGGTEQKRRLSRLDRLHSKQINLELKAIEVNELAIDAEQKVIEAQLKHVRDAFDNELTGFRELFGTSGEATVRDVEIDILQEELRAVRAEIQKIELRVQAPERIQVVQSATLASP